jgi:hypothetical protein
MMAASLLALTAVDPVKAMEMVSRARGLLVPETPEQRDWVSNLRAN